MAWPLGWSCALFRFQLIYWAFVCKGLCNTLEVFHNPGFHMAVCLSETKDFLWVLNRFVKTRREKYTEGKQFSKTSVGEVEMN